MFSFVERNILYDIRNDPQYFLRDELLDRRMMRLSGNAPVNYLLTNFLRPALLLEL